MYRAGGWEGRHADTAKKRAPVSQEGHQALHRSHLLRHPQAPVPDSLHFRGAKRDFRREEVTSPYKALRERPGCRFVWLQILNPLLISLLTSQMFYSPTKMLLNTPHFVHLGMTNVLSSANVNTLAEPGKCHISWENWSISLKEWS